MVNMFIEPQMDDRKLDKEVKKAEQKVAEVEQLTPEMDTRGLQRQIDSVEGPSFEGDGTGFSSVRRGGGGGVGGGGAMPLPMRSPGGLMSKGGAAAAASAAAPVALAGAGLFALDKIQTNLGKVSGRLGQQQAMMEAAITNLKAPFGDAVAEALMPGTENLLDASVEFRKVAENQGLGVAIQDFAAPQFGQIISGSMTDALQAGGIMGRVTGGIFGGRIGSQIGGALGALQGLQTNLLLKPLNTLSDFLTGSDLAANMGAVADAVGDFDVDVSGLFDDVRASWTGWPPIQADWMGWPDVSTQWADIGGWPNLGSLWSQAGGWPNVGMLWTEMGGWPNLGGLWPGWSSFITPVNLSNFVIGSNNQDTDDTTTTTTTSRDLDDFTNISVVSPGPGPGTRVIIGEGPVAGPTSSTGLQQGGIVKPGREIDATLHGPEAVIPLDRLQGGSDAVVDALQDIHRLLRGQSGDNRRGGSDRDTVRRLERIERETKRHRQVSEELMRILKDIRSDRGSLSLGTR